eukprot:TRINITY_DN55986_c0_g1_i1.p1 TRINITY_DN55986_c0_g1~~TRINITY_DN55986_c0_g1_i1.p1  ORF type:complete len:650 (+),score=186.91 TRINITY_DN55986_c0_g1_i1:81-1952(+)
MGEPEGGASPPRYRLLFQGGVAVSLLAGLGYFVLQLRPRRQTRRQQHSQTDQGRPGAPPAPPGAAGLQSSAPKGQGERGRGPPLPAGGDPESRLAEIRRQLAEVVERMPNGTMKRFAWEAGTPRSPPAVVRPHHRPWREYPPGDPVAPCPCNNGSCAAAFCTPNAWRHWEPGVRVFPVSYSLPDELFAATLPYKDQDSSRTVPGMQLEGTYKWHNESAFYGDYARSFYCTTFKKGGWQALRHIEIIAAGCMPFFIDLEYVPELTLVGLPKQLLLEARDLPGVHFDCRTLQVRINHAVFPRARYDALLRELMRHARAHLTATQHARWLLKATGHPAARSALFVQSWQPPPFNGCHQKVHTIIPKRKCKGSAARLRCPPVRAISSSQTPPSVSECNGPGRERSWPWINCDCNSHGAPLKAQGSYTTWTLLHGMRGVLGAGAVDSVPIPFMYKPGPTNRFISPDHQKEISARLYGKGFGYAWKLDNIGVNRSRLEERVRALEFDVVFIIDRKDKLAEHVLAHYPASRVFVINDEDIPQYQPMGGPAARAATHLVRELPDCGWYRPEAPLSDAMKRCADFAIVNNHRKTGFGAPGGCFDDSGLNGWLEGKGNKLSLQTSTAERAWYL